ncbi:MAG: tungsten ABC transporter substrate-binding protein [Gammaproteobacteria bacterium]|nr:tungsten ABC transporter substrate-binding protein [Gammaproteobacteria bacterium]
MLRQALLLVITSLITSTTIANESPLRLATTTSTANSGLMSLLLPKFTEETSIEVHLIAVGTGKALRLGREGDVDAVLVHARVAEDEFVSGGYGIDRTDVMYNDFIIVGPQSDPAGVTKSKSVAEVLINIHTSKQPFISRGDDSGTHKRELILWQSSSKTPDGNWYREVGQGMGKTLQIANEIDGYTMTDRGTWLAYQSKLDIELLFEDDPPLYNPYGIIAVNPERHADINYTGASKLIKWITSPKVQKMIGEFKIKGQQLFVPSAENDG